MTEFEEKYLEELKKQHEESLKYLKQCDIERRIKEDEFDEGCHKLAIAMTIISGIGFLIGLIFAVACC